MENGFHAIYFDMNGEYYDWCQAVGGAYLDQRASTRSYIEPMEIRPKVSDRDDNLVDAMTARVTRTVSLLADTTDEALLVPCDQAILQVLKEMHIDRNDPDSWYKNKLRMTDWYAALCEIHTPAGQDLRNKVYRFLRARSATCLARANR